MTIRFEIKISQYPTIFFQCNSAGKILEINYNGKEEQYWDDFCSRVLDKELEVLLQKNNPLEFISATDVWSPAYEVLKLAFATFFGKDYLYCSNDQVICPCFGLRKSEKENLLHKAKMGCGLCLNSQEQETNCKKKVQSKRYFKNLPNADWVLLVDEKLHNFSKTSEWGLKLQSMNGQTILIEFSKIVSQREEEEMQLELQNYLRGEIGEELLFFLVSA